MTFYNIITLLYKNTSNFQRGELLKIWRIIMKCPNCNLENPKIAQRCDCGYDFNRKKIRQPYIKSKTSTHKKPDKVDLDDLISKILFKKNIKELTDLQYGAFFYITFMIFFVILIIIKRFFDYLK
jgi:hypothetical protein